MQPLSDYDVEVLSAAFQDVGIKPSHARRVLRRFYENAGTLGPDDLPGARIRELLRDVPLRQSRVLCQSRSLDGTTKLLIGLDAGGAVESVFMPGYRSDRAAGCISSQIGCAMGCDFCASTRNGLERNLTAGEIVEQFLHLKALAQGLGRRLRTLVFMGMGEPMHNLDNVIPAIRRIADPDMGGLGWRQITVSTVGIVPGIERLAEADLNVHLAVSLHAPDDPTRARIVPTTKRYRVADIVAAARRFHEQTGRIVTIEYCLLEGVNDSLEQAHLLADLLAGFRAHVNLIPYNAIGAGLSGATYRRPAPDRLVAFLDTLRERRVVTHFRDTRGDDVNAACGQLRQSAVSAR